MALIDKLAGGPAAWRGLGHATRRAVLRRAREGRPYPDPEVAVLAVQWARWVRPLPWWRHLLRAVGLAIIVQLASGLALGVLALVASALLGGGFGVERGSFWVLRSLWELGSLALVFWLWRWWDAGRILRLNDSPAGTP
jgi:hypothetical protein